MDASLETLRRRVTREEINAMPLVAWEGEVKIIRNFAQWKAAEARMREDGILGFDTETRPTFRKGKLNAPALIQIATADTVYLTQLGWVPFGAYQASVLSDPSIIKVGVGIGDDMRALANIFPFEAAGTCDLGEIAKMCNLPNHGLRSLAASIFGWRISKGSQCSNWSLRQLSPRQIAYAATDAWIGRMIYMRLRDLGLVQSSQCAIPA